MAAVGFTPISLYYSTTPSATPSASNLVDAELAINITDGKLYYKDNLGVVQLLASKDSTAISPGGTNRQVQFNNNGSFGGNSGFVYDVAGNVGIGVTPYNWDTGFRVIDINTGGAVSSSNDTLDVSSNAYLGNLGFVYKNNGRASIYRQVAGTHQFLTSPTSGTAGSTFVPTAVLTTDVNGNVGIGTTGPARLLHLSGGANITYFQMSNNASGNTNADGFQIAQDGVNVDIINREAGFMAFDTNNTERLRITSTGAISVGSSGTDTGTSGQVLTSQGSGSPPVWAAVPTTNPAGATNEIQYKGSGNTFAASSALTFNPVTSILSVNTIRIGNPGNSSTVVGFNALNNGSYSGMFNTAVGNNSQRDVSSGNHNTGLGYATLFTCNTGSNNTAIGSLSLYSNSTGQSNTAVGYKAGYGNSTGGRNTFIGFNAGENATGSDNVCIGYNAASVATGSSNTFIGPAAGELMTTGQSNTIIGGFSGNSGGLDIRTQTGFIVLSNGSGNPRVYWNSAGNMVSLGTISDSIGDVRSIPQTTTSSNYILQVSDNGKHINYTLNNGSVEVPSLGSVSAGYVATIFNNTNTTITIFQIGGSTLRQAGTTNTGNRTLSAYGLATILCVANNTYVISGTGLA